MRNHVTHAVLSLAIMLAAGACDAGDSFSSAGSGPTTKTVLVSDPVENGFTVEMPKGWRNMGYTARTFDITRFVLNSVSPDGSTVIFVGDPSLPMYFEPSFPAINVTRIQMKVNPLIKIAKYQPAQVFLPGYVKQKFGNLEAFKIESTEDDPETQAVNEEKLREQGYPSPVSAAVVRFTYTEGGKPMHALMTGTTSRTPHMWSAGIGGISTPGDPVAYRGMLIAWIKSFKINPDWTAKQQALHEQRMEEIRQAGQRGRSNLQAMADRHQMRMNAIQATGDASMKSYYERSDASDRTQRNFLNYINEENTVATSDGKTHQVTSGYQRYFMHKRTGAYVGGDAHTNLDSLRKMGLNPDDYTEVKIKK